MTGIRFVIWGLRNSRHSHRYIHKGFYQTLTRLNAEVLWLDDLEKNRSLIKSGDLIIVSGIACNFLPVNEKATYILHNVDDPIISNLKNKIFLQVFTNDSTGEKIDETVSLWNDKHKTLYQPWGLPESLENWLKPRDLRTKNENWIGAIWDNELNQGNRKQLEIYRTALKSKGIKFRKLGGTRSISIEGLSSKKSFEKVNQSRIGAAIVGSWQKENGYLPCRAFKNIAAGAIPISNSNMTNVFGDGYLFVPSIEELVEVSLSMDYEQIRERSESCKEIIGAYSYDRALQRMVNIAL